MVERYDDSLLSEILKAAADPTRRAILTFLSQEGAMRVTDLAARFDMSLNAVSKHIKVLENAGLIIQGQKAQSKWTIGNFFRIERNRRTTFCANQ